MIELKKYYLFLIPVLFWPFFVFGQAAGQPPDASLGQRCFDYYKLQSVEIALSPDQNSYIPGESVKLLGYLENKNSYPVVGGNLIGRLNLLPAGVIYGTKDIILERVMLENLNLLPGEKKSVVLTYQLPGELVSGRYALTFYFNEGNNFDISGLHFSNNVYGAAAQFDISGGSKGLLRFDTARIKVNNDSTTADALAAKVFPASAEMVLLSVPLMNGKKESRTVAVSYQLFYWDSLKPVNLLKSEDFNVALKPSEVKDIGLNIDISSRTSYLVKLTANSQDESSWSYFRIVKSGFRPRLFFVGLNSFPLLKEESNNVAFACYANTAPGSGIGKLELTVKNSSGVVLDSRAYVGDMSEKIDIFSSSLTGLGNQDGLIVSAKLYDNSEALVDEVNITYDCSEFSSSVCSKLTVILKWALALAGLLVVGAAVYFTFIKRKKEMDENITP